MRIIEKMNVTKIVKNIEHDYRCHGIDKNRRQGLITGDNDTGDSFSPVSLIPVKCLSLREFLKIQNGPNGILRGRGKTYIHEKT
jgi:hypothetical protein